jgi:hypothetical protein
MLMVLYCVFIYIFTRDWNHALLTVILITQEKPKPLNKLARIMFAQPVLGMSWSS